jgi:hypothetical protein
MYQFSITNIDQLSNGINLDALKAFLHLNENNKIVLEGESKLITGDPRALSFNMIRAALQYQPKDRFLVEYLGTLRHAKMVYQDDQVLAWASYDRADMPLDLNELALPLQTGLDKQPNADFCSSTAYVRGRKSGKDIVVKYPNRDELVKLAKYGSWFNEEEVTLELVRNDRFDALRFVEGKVKEKRGFNHHDNYKNTLEWLRFDEKVIFHN